MAILKNGSKGDEVKKLQSALIEKGYDVGSSGADGVYGSKTQAAVTAYQKANGLTADGIAGAQTTGSLYKTANDATMNPDTSRGTNIPKGVTESHWDKMNSAFGASENVSKAQDKADTYLSGYEQKANNSNIISQSTKDKLNSSFSAPASVLQADRYLTEQLKKIQSGRTSYTDDVEAMMAQIQNREKFSYDADKDPLFQQALASAMKSGKTAMEDTIGQASALTGGYGSTYATSAGNQAYNAFIEDAYNNLPEYYKMALEAYQIEGQDMYNLLAMFSDADAQEYQRMLGAYDATSQWRNTMYGEAYQRHQDDISNAYNSANLQLSENSQLVNNALNLYNSAQNRADTLYAQEFEKWNAEVNQAAQLGSLMNSDAWAQTNFDYQKERDKIADQQWERQFAASQARRSGGGSGGGNPTLKEPTQSQMQGALKAFEEGGDPALMSYLGSVPSTYDRDAIMNYAVSNAKDTDAVLEYKTYTKVEDTWNGLWGVDNNDIVQDSSGKTYRIDELPKDIRKDLTKLKKDEVWAKEW